MKITKTAKRDLYRASVKLPGGKYKSVYGKTVKEVEQKVDKLKQDIANNLFVEPDNTTYSEWVNYWQDNYLSDVKPRTAGTYKSINRLYLEPVFGNRKLQNIEYKDVQELINDIYYNKDLSSKTAKNAATVLKKIFNDAIRNGLLAVNPAINLVLPKSKQKPSVNYLREDKIGQFIKTGRELYPDYAPFYEFLLFTGLRLSEFLGAQIEQYNSYNGTLLIDRQVIPSQDYEFTTPKHDVVRTIALNKRCIEIVESSIKTTKNFRDKGIETYNPDNFIFTNLDGSNIKLSTFYKHFKNIVKAIDEPSLRLHDLRHTYATLALEAGMDIKTLQENLGHADPAFTLKRYAHSTNKMQVESANKLQSFIEDLM